MTTLPDARPRGATNPMISKQQSNGAVRTTVRVSVTVSVAQVLVYGVPGAGKSFTARRLASDFGFRFCEGDEWLPEDMCRTPAPCDTSWHKKLRGTRCARFEEEET